MQEEKRGLKRLLAAFLIFTLTFANFAFTTTAYASSITETLFGERVDTSGKNVKFEAFFEVEDEEVTSTISDVNNQELAITARLTVKKAGYLKDAKIEILENKANEGLNFVMKDPGELPELVEKIEDDVIYLKQVNNSEEDVEFEIPIKYKNEEYFDESNLSKVFKLSLKGTYVDGKGNEIEISRETKLRLAWTDDRSASVETNVEKYIDYGEGVILQTKIQVDNSVSEMNSLPVKQTELTIEVPKYFDNLPTKVNVIANSTLGTNGENYGEVSFSEENWEYDEKENVLKIVISNDKQLVVVDEYKDEFIQDEDKILVEEERYYNVPGIDELLVTYTYEGAQPSKENVLSETSIEQKMVLLSGVAKDDNMSVTTSTNVYEYVLSDSTSDMVSLSKEVETKEISKAFFYANKLSNIYDIDIKSKTIVNVSYKDVIEKIYVEDLTNSYVGKDSRTYNNQDIYYKQISISKDNMESILGEDGEIEIQDENGNFLGIINNNLDTDEYGNYNFEFEERNSKIKIITTNPINEGNLVINNTKTIREISLDKATIESLDSLSNKQTIRAKYVDVDKIADVETSEGTVQLNDTETKATIEMDRKNLSTLDVNEGIQMRISLNNAEITSDIYGYSEFDIEFPEYVESIETKDAMIYSGEGLEIKSIECDRNKIKVIIDGMQAGIGSVQFTNGTTIVFYADIKTNMFTPLTSQIVRMTAINQEATNYNNEGLSEVLVTFSAPKGLVTVNSIYNYDNEGSYLTSINQGTKMGMLEINSEEKRATTELVIMNNNANVISDLVILGRIPFVGDENGTTLDVKMASRIIPINASEEDFIIYYSENENANKELEDIENGWNQNPEALENVKSYLIVPSEREKEFEEATVLRFSYDFLIPGDLQHNEYAYGTLITYYRNISAVADTNEISYADIVGLTTGVGPEITLTLNSNTNIIREQEMFDVTIKATNTGDSYAENVRVNFERQPSVYLVNYEVIEGNSNWVENKSETKESLKKLYVEQNAGEITVDDLNNYLKQLENINTYPLTVSKERLYPGETIEFVLTLQTAEFAEEHGTDPVTEKEEGVTYYEASEGVYYRNLGKPESKIINIVATAEANGLGKTISAKSPDITAKRGLVSIYEQADGYGATLKPGDVQRYYTLVENISDTDLENIVVTQYVPEEFTFEKAEGATYDENTRIITWNIDRLAKDMTKQLNFAIKLIAPKEGLYKDKISISAQLRVNNEMYEAKPVSVYIGRPILVVKQEESGKTNVKEGESIEYLFSIENQGSVTADSINLIDKIPNGVKAQSARYTIDGKTTKVSIKTKDEVKLDLKLEAGKTMLVRINALAETLDNFDTIQVENYANVKLNDSEEYTTNSVIHTISPSENKKIKPNSVSTSTSVDRTKTETVVSSAKTKIIGYAWLDANRDGNRTSEEQMISGLMVTLIDNQTGAIKGLATTNASGMYTFSDVENGTYLIVVDYETAKYNVTTYKKSGVSNATNSDFITTQIEQGGKSRTAAVSDVLTVNGAGLSNIDVGLTLADVFDLKIDKSITKVTVQTSKDTKTEKYDNSKLVKTEIASKLLVGSIVDVEYEITVSNVGDIKGYAKKIVDYVPEGMIFDPTLEENKEWYEGSDGNLYTEKLANEELSKGQTATVKLVLTRVMTEENTDIISNKTEIYEDYNSQGDIDTNSIPGNKSETENDLSSADIAIMVKTGDKVLYISIILIILTLGITAVFLVNIKFGRRGRMIV